MASPKDRVYRFDSFLVDIEKKTLFNNGVPVDLSGKAFETLVTLIERQANPVSREELMQLLWPHTEVESGNLDKQISKLREALGDEDAQLNRHIKTIPRFGYQFVAQVEEWTETEGIVLEPSPALFGEEPVVTEPKKVGAIRKIRLWLLLGLSAMGLVVAFIAWVGVFKKPEISAIIPASPLGTIGDQSIVLIGRNFQKGSIVRVIYPLGDSVTLVGNQVQFGTETSLVILSDFKGHWGKHAFEVHSPYGRISAPFYFEALKHIQSPIIEAIIPESPEATNQEESIVVYGHNFGPEVIPEIIFPDGRSATLQGRQIPRRTSTALTMLANFSERPGIYKVRARNANGTWSEPFPFVVRERLNRQ